MASFVTTNVSQTVLTSGSRLVLTPTGSITFDGLRALIASGGGITMTLSGLVWSSTTAIYSVVNSGPTLENRYTITASGQVIGDILGMRLQGPSQVWNYGQILGATGIEIWPSDFHQTNAVITNHGRIDGDYAAIAAQGQGGIGGDQTIVNYGTISATGWGVLDQSLGMTWTFCNSGRIEGGIWLLDGDDRLFNQGSILGDLYMGDGQDQADLRLGTLTGAAFLGGGDDLALLGTGAEFVVGEDGTDTVSYEYARGRIVLNLAAPSTNAGAAAGDQFEGVEVFVGTGAGADKMVGDGADNRFEGRGGNDTLMGGAGADSLDGQAGLDVLTGNSGADRFLFTQADGFADRITDFGRGAAPDKIVVTAAAFGILDLAPGALAATAFVARADTLAQDADDRFVFDTTTSTLWADPDGNGAAEALAIAQVQAGMILRASDLLIA